MLSNYCVGEDSFFFLRSLYLFIYLFFCSEFCHTLEKTLESLLNCKEIQVVHPKGYQSSVFIGKINVEAEIPILWSHDEKSSLILEDPDAGKH